MPADYYASEGYDQSGEILCTSAEHLTASLGLHLDGVTAPAHAPAPSGLFAAAADIARTAATTLPPALPPTV